MNILSPVPGWPLHTLESLCDVFTDGDWIESKNQSPEGIRLIQTGNVGEGFFKDRRDKARFISEDTFSGLKCCEVFEGDCLISRLPDPVGRACILPATGNRMITAVDCTILRLKKDQLLPDFFKFFSQSDAYLNKVESLTSGATRKRISRKNLGLIEVPTPPIPEQKRIVAMLDQVFADIEQARAKTEQNLKNARELFESYLQQVFSQRGVGWVEKPIKDVVDSVLTGPFGSMLHKSDYVSDGIPLVNPINIIGDKIIPNDSKTITNETAERLSSYILSANDLVIGRRGDIGRCAVVSDDQDGWVCGTGCFYIKPSGQLNPYYLAHLLRSPKYRDSLERISTGATMKNLSNSNLKNFVVCFPSDVTKQEDALDAIDEMKKRVKSVEDIYIKKLTALDDLKKSILQKAFSGELTRVDKESESKGAAA